MHLVRTAILLSLALLVACAPEEPDRRKPVRPGDTGSPDTGAPDTGDGDPSDTDDSDPPARPALYPDDQLQSPIPPFVRDRLVALAARGDGLEPHVFMKVGDSITEDTNALGCFAGSKVNLADRDDLQPTLDHFLAGDASGSTPFDRDSRAAEVGETADWALTGDPSPVEKEMDALDPAFALIQYGTNDMQMGTTYLSAIWNFGDTMLQLLDFVADEGVVPVLVTIPPRLDIEEAGDWVPTYNAVIRGLAQGRQVPLVDLELGLRSIDGYGLSSDGVHLDAYDSGACKLSEQGLQYGNNLRNLLLLDALDRVRRAVLQGEALDDAGEALEGAGTPADPFVVEAFPFTDLRDTRDATTTAIDVYDGCGSEADESGPEYVYRLDLEKRTTVRALVFDQGDVDVDLHLLGDTVDGAACIDRDDADLEMTLDAGTWHFVLDSYVKDGDVRAGEFLFVVVKP